MARVFRQTNRDSSGPLKIAWHIIAWHINADATRWLPLDLLATRSR
jgi:hypothetical protein